MKKLSGSLESRIKNLVAIQELAHKHLANSVEEFHNSNAELVLRQVTEQHKHLQETRRELSKHVAEFRLKHAGELNTAALSNPKFISQLTDRHPDGLFGEGMNDAFGWGRYMHEILEHLDHPVPDVHSIEIPIALDCPEIINVGDYYVITGSSFGSVEGSICFKDFTEFPDLRIDATVLYWADDAVQFTIPGTAEMIPLHAHGRIYITRSDGKFTCPEVTVEPMPDVYIHTHSYSDKDYKVELDSTPLSYKYKKVKLFKSPILPESYELWNHSLFDLPGLFLKGSNLTGVSSFSWVEFEADYCVVEDNRINSHITITANWYWDYWVRVENYVLVPPGFSVDSGWEPLH